MKTKIFTLPNYITMSRLILIPFMYIFILNHQIIFFMILFYLAGLSDVLDGFLARKLHLVSSIGKKLDSIVDFIFFIFATYFFYLIYPDILKDSFYLILSAVLLLMILIISGLIKYKKTILFHTYILKIVGLMVFILVGTTYFYQSYLLWRIVFVLLNIGYIESILMLYMGHTNEDHHSIFIKKRIG